MKGKTNGHVWGEDEEEEVLPGQLDPMRLLCHRQRHSAIAESGGMDFVLMIASLVPVSGDSGLELEAYRVLGRSKWSLASNLVALT